MKLFPKLKLTPKLIQLAYNFIDVEASADTALPDQRVIEYAFIIEKLTSIPAGKVLDVGCTARLNVLPAALTSIGWEVWGLDLREFKFRHPSFHFVPGDASKTDFPDNFFDAVYAVSVLEHMGLSGRYGITSEDPERDAKTIDEIGRIIRSGGVLLCTVPYGKEMRTVKYVQRIYDKASLERLFSGWARKTVAFYGRENDGYWTQLSEEEANEVENPDGESALALLELLAVK